MTILDVSLKGCFVQHHFLDDAGILELEKFFDLPESRPGVVEFDKNDIARSDSNTLIDVSNKLEKLIKQVDKHLEFHKLWFQTTNKNSINSFEAKASPFLPHIDTQRYTKAMLYMTDVNESSGPFTTSLQNPNNFEDLRKQINKKDPIALEYQRNRSEFDQSIIDFVPVTGSKGMLVVFDTNTPHFAGKVEGDKSRRILRFDYWSKKQILKN